MINPRSGSHQYKIRILILILLSLDVYALRSWDQNYEQTNWDIEAIQNNNEDFSATSSDKQNTEKKAYIAGSDYKLYNMISEMSHHICDHEIKVHFFFYRHEKLSYIRSINSSFRVLEHLLSKYPHYFYKKLENESSYNYLNNLIIIPEDDASNDGYFSDARLNQYHNEQDIFGIDRDIKNHKDYYEYNIPNEKHYIGKDINVYVDNIISPGFNTSNSIYNTPARGDDSYYEFGEPVGQNFKGKDVNVNVFQPYSGNIQTLISNDLQDDIYDKNDNQEKNELNISSDKNYNGKNVLEEQQSHNDLFSDNNNVKKENLKVPYDGVYNEDEQVYEFNYPNNNYKVKNVNVNVLVSSNEEQQCRNDLISGANDNNNGSNNNLEVQIEGVYNQDNRSYEFNCPNNNYKGKNEIFSVLVSGKEEQQSRNDLISGANDNNNVSEEKLEVPYDGVHNQDERSYEFNNPNSNYKGKNENVNVLVSGNEEHQSRNDLISGATDNNNGSKNNLEVPIDVLYNQDEQSYEFKYPNNNYKGKYENVNMLVSGNEEQQSHNGLISGANYKNIGSKNMQGYELNYPNNKYKGVDINVDLNAATDHNHDYTESSTQALTNVSYLRGSGKQFHQDDEDVANAMEHLEPGGSSWADTDNYNAEEIINISKDIIPQYNTGSNTETKNEAENLEDQYQYSDKVIMDNANSQSASTKGDQEADPVDSLNTKGLLEYPSEKYRSMNNVVLAEDVLPQVLPEIQETVSYKPCGQQEDISQPNKYVIDQAINSIHTSVDREKKPVEKATGTSMEDTIPCFTASEILDMGPKTHNYLEKSLQPKSKDIPCSHKFKSIPRKHIHRESFRPKGEFHLDDPVDDICEVDTSYPSANPSAKAKVIVPYDFANEEINSQVPSNVFPSIKSYKPFYSLKKPYNNIFFTRPRYYKPNTSTREYSNPPQEEILGPQYIYKPLMTGFNTYQPHVHFQPTWPSFGKTNDSPFTTICNKHSHTFKDIKPSSISHDMRTYRNHNKNLKHNQNNPPQMFKLKTVPQRKLHYYDIEQTHNTYKYLSKSPTLKLMKDKEHELGSIKFSEPTCSYYNPFQLTRTNYIPKIYSKSNPRSLNKRRQATILAKNNIKTKRNPCSCSYYTPILDQISQNPTSTYAYLMQQNNSTYNLPIFLDTKGFHSIPCHNKNIYIEQDPFIHVASQPIYDTPVTSGSVTDLNQPLAIRKENIAATSTVNSPCVHKKIHTTPKKIINGIYETRPNDGSIYTRTISKNNNNGQYTQTPSQIVCNAEFPQNLGKKHPHRNEYPQTHYHIAHSGSSQDILRYPQPMAYKKSQWPKFQYTSPQIQYGEHATVAPSINPCQSLYTNTPGIFNKIPRTGYTSPSKYDKVFLWSQQKPNQNVKPLMNAYFQKQYKFNKYPNYVQIKTHPWLENQPLTFHNTETPGYSTAYGYTYNGQPPITQHNSIYTVTNHEHKLYKLKQNICQSHDKSSNNHPTLYQYPSYKNNYNPVLESLPNGATPNIEPTSSYKTKSNHNFIESRVPYQNYVIPCVSSEKVTSSKMQHLLGSVPRNPFTNVNPLVWFGRANPIYNKQFISGTEYPESNAYNLYKKGNIKNFAGNFNYHNYIPKLNADNTFYNQNPLDHEIQSPEMSNLIQGNKYITNRIPTTHFHTSQIHPILMPSYSTTSKAFSFREPKNPQAFDVNQASYDQGTIQMKIPSSYNFNFDKPCQTIPPTLNYEYSRPNNFVNEPCNYNSQIPFETLTLSKEQYSPFETPQSSSKVTQYPTLIYPQQLGSPYMSDMIVKYNQKCPCFTKINTHNNQPDDDVQLTQSPSFKPCIFSDDKLNNVNFNVPKLQTFNYIPKTQDANRNEYKTHKSIIMTGLPSMEPYSFGYGDPPHKTSTHNVTFAPNFNTLRATISQLSHKYYKPKFKPEYNLFYNQNPWILQNPTLRHEIKSAEIPYLIQENKCITNRIPTTHFHTLQIHPILTPSYSTTSKPISFTTPQNPQSFQVNQDSYDQGTLQIKTPSSYNFDFGKPCQRISPPFASLTQRYYNPTLNNECSRPNHFVNVPCKGSQKPFETPALSKEQYPPFETPQSSSKFTQDPALIYPQQLESPYTTDMIVKYNQKSPCYTKINTLNDQPDDDVQLTQSPSFKPCIFSDDKFNNLNFNVPKQHVFKHIPKSQDANRNEYKTHRSIIMTGLPSMKPYSFGYGDPPHKTSTHNVTFTPNFKTLRLVNEPSYKTYIQNVYNAKDSLNYFPLRFKTETKMFNRPSTSNIPCLNYQSPNKYISTSPCIADFSSESYPALPNIDYNPCVETNSIPTISSTLPPTLSVSSHEAFNRGKNQPNWEAFRKFININKDTTEAINSINSFIPTNAPNRLINPQRDCTKSQDPYKKTNFKQSNTANAKSVIHNPGINVDYNSSPFISQIYPETNLHATVKPYAQSYTNKKSINRNVFDTSSDNHQLKTLRQPKYYGRENINYNNHYSPFKNNKPYYSNDKINDPMTSINYSPQCNQLYDQTPEWAINNIKDVYKNQINEEIPKILPLQYFDDNFNDPNANFSEKLSVDLGRLTVAKYDDNNRYLIKTNNPLVNLLVWKSKIKTLNGNLVIQVKDYPAMNFLPVLKGPICIDEANKLAKDIVTKMYGDPIVLKGKHSVNEPYAVILNGACKRNVLWPAQFSS